MAVSAETITDNALWVGGIFLFEDQRSLDYSVEYQARLDENATSLSNQFLELQAYRKTTPSLLINGAYRHTRFDDHYDNRLYVGGYWDITRASAAYQDNPRGLQAVVQFGYQHDFNAKFDDELMPSNSIRTILYLSRQMTEVLKPVLLAGVLTTWNDAYSFGVDKIRLGGGVIVRMPKQGRLRAHYIWEKAYFRAPKKQTNIFWLRYEASFGN